MSSCEPLCAIFPRGVASFPIHHLKRGVWPLWAELRKRPFKEHGGLALQGGSLNGNQARFARKFARSICVQDKGR